MGPGIHHQIKTVAAFTDLTVGKERGRGHAKHAHMQMSSIELCCKEKEEEQWRGRIKGQEQHRGCAMSDGSS